MLEFFFDYQFLLDGSFIDEGLPFFPLLSLSLNEPIMDELLDVQGDADKQIADWQNYQIIR